MTPVQALQLVDNILADIPFKRADSVQVQNAILTLSDVIKPKPTPEPVAKKSS